MSNTEIPVRRSLDADATASGSEAHRVACLFETRAAAEHAAADLVAAGFDRSDIDIIDQNRGPTPDAARETGGIWESIKRLFTGDEDCTGYYEGVRRGQSLVSVHARTSAASSQAVEILERHNPLDRDVQEAAWRQEGWTGTVPADVAAPGMPADAVLAPPGAAGAGSVFQTSPPSAAAARGAGAKDVIPVVEEEVSVGKREVSGGRVRVHTRIVETPVEEEVRLREEHARVERRPVDRPVEAGDEAFRERMVEVTERREEPVVAKSARVTEEVVVRKDETDRTERVTDRARRTDVRIDDERRERG